MGGLVLGWAASDYISSPSLSGFILTGFDALLGVVGQRGAAVVQDGLVEAGLQTVCSVVLDAGDEGAVVDHGHRRPDDPRRDHRDGDEHRRERDHEGREHPVGDRHGGVEQLGGDAPEADREPRRAHHHHRRQQSGDQHAEGVAFEATEAEVDTDADHDVDPHGRPVLVDVVLDELTVSIVELDREEGLQDEETEPVVEGIDSSEQERVLHALRGIPQGLSTYKVSTKMTISQ